MFCCPRTGGCPAAGDTSEIRCSQRAARYYRRARPDGRGGRHYDWLSGPNDDYGFTISPTEGCSLDDHRGFILNFLDQIDPATGFIGD